MTDKTVKITCEGAAMVPIGEFEDFQGTLKNLHEKQYVRLKQAMLRDGFHTAIDVWKLSDDAKPRKVLDGHQRIHTLRTMIKKEGFELDGGKLPVDWIFADTEKQAKRIVLEKMSQYGRYDEETIYEFMNMSGLSWGDDVKPLADFPGINMGTFAAGYFGEPSLPEVDSSTPSVSKIEEVNIAKLKPHPRNYRTHSEDEVAHLVDSLKAYGFYKNIVIARDGTVLAGHGIVQAAKTINMTKVPAVRLDLDADDPEALKILTGDNEIGQLGLKNDPRLVAMLREVQEKVGLLGTGFDEMMIQGLEDLLTSQGTSADNRDEWANMPDFSPGDSRLELRLWFDNEKIRASIVKKLDLNTRSLSNARILQSKYPSAPEEDLKTVKWVPKK